MRDARQENVHLRGSESSHFRRPSRGLTGNAAAVCTEHNADNCVEVAAVRPVLVPL
jgi:hypothetical protein